MSETTNGVLVRGKPSSDRTVMEEPQRVLARMTALSGQLEFEYQPEVYIHNAEVSLNKKQEILIVRYYLFYRIYQPAQPYREATWLHSTTQFGCVNMIGCSLESVLNTCVFVQVGQLSCLLSQTSPPSLFVLPLPAFPSRPLGG